MHQIFKLSANWYINSHPTVVRHNSKLFSNLNFHPNQKSSFSITGKKFSSYLGRHFGLTSFLFKKFFGNPLQKNCFATVSEERESYSKFDQSNIKSLFLELLTFQCIFWMKKDKKNRTIYYILLH